MPEKQADDVTTTRKTKRRTKLFWNIFRDVTNDTTNKEPRPEVPPQGTGERGELSDLLATCRSPRHH